MRRNAASRDTSTEPHDGTKRAAGTVSGQSKRLGMILRGLCVKLSAAVLAASAHEGGATSRTCRGQDSGPGWNEIFLNPNEAQKTEAADEALQLGHSIVVLHGLATTAECLSIRSEASAAASGQRHRAERRYSRLWDLARRVANVRQGMNPLDTYVNPISQNGLVRVPLVEMLGQPGQQLCDLLFHRTLEKMGEQAGLRQLLSNVFVGCSLEASFFTNRKIGFTEGEPAINVYTCGGVFPAHQDKQSLTILIQLSPACDFEGGGTAFWSIKDAGSPGALLNYTERNPVPTMTLKPTEGTALLFSGTVIHAGSPVVSGERSVLVASFSPSSDQDGSSDWSKELVASSGTLGWILGALEGLDGL